MAAEEEVIAVHGFEKPDQAILPLQIITWGIVACVIVGLFAFFHSGPSPNRGIQIGSLAIFAVIAGFSYFYGRRRAAHDPVFATRLAEARARMRGRAMANLYSRLVWVGIALVTVIVINAIQR